MEFRKIMSQIHVGGNEVREIDVQGVKLQVKQRLPILVKHAIVDNVLEAHRQDATNAVIKELLVNVLVVKNYTNLEFSEEDEIQLDETYDILRNSGILKAVIDAIPKEEYGELMDFIKKSLDEHDKMQTSVSGIVKELRLLLMENYSGAKQEGEVDAIDNVVSLFRASNEENEGVGEDTENEGQEE